MKLKEIRDGQGLRTLLPEVRKEKEERGGGDGSS
jgi:hypothetical protein